MKKLMSIAALAVVASVVAASAQQEVLSANAVGYVKRSVPGGQLFEVASIPFDNLAATDGTQLYKFGECQAAEDLKPGDKVSFWVAGSQTWETYTKNARTGKWPQGALDHQLMVGEAFFVQNNSSDVTDVTLAGQVPAEKKIERLIEYEGNGRFSFVSSPYPVDTTFGATEIAEQLPPGSKVMFWNPVTAWATYTKTARTGKWPQGALDTEIKAGAGFFVQSAGDAGYWEPERPYSWPCEPGE